MMSNETVTPEAIDEFAGPLLPRRRVRDTADLDITPMIDIVFLLLIFFLVASIPDMQRAGDLPAARHGEGVNPREAVIFTVAESDDPAPARVFLGDAIQGTPLSADPDQQAQQIRRAVETGFKNEGKLAVLIRADRGLPYGEVARVTDAVGGADVEGANLNLAVREIP